MRMLK
jgi:predicted acylesterase/phospholipase RssA